MNDDDAHTPIATPRASERVTARELAIGNELLRGILSEARMIRVGIQATCALVVISGFAVLLRLMFGH